MSNYNIEDIYRISSTRPNTLQIYNKKTGRIFSEIVIGDNNGCIYFLRPNKKDNSVEVIIIFQYITEFIFNFNNIHFFKLLYSSYILYFL